jgi:molybdopterin biosynthesis enzyme
MQGARVLSRPVVDVELQDALTNRSGRRNHLPVRIRSEGGRLVARSIRSAGSADVVAHAAANGLAILDAARMRADAGEKALALLLGNFLDRDGTS